MRYVVKVNGKEYDVEVEKLGGPYQSLTRTTAYVQGVPVAVAPQPVAAPAPAPVSSGSGADVTSPMPGKVFKLVAKPGDSVSEGQVIMILEAMKMENEIVAPQAGVVDAILVKEGDMVETETVLATLK